MSSGRIEQRPLLRAEQPPADTTLVVRGGRDTVDKFAIFRTIYLPTAGELGKYGFELVATAQRPHFTVRLDRADDRELGELLAALGPARPNPQYARTDVWREEG